VLGGFGCSDGAGACMLRAAKAIEEGNIEQHRYQRCKQNAGFKQKMQRRCMAGLPSTN
jgi:hypothetical protein